MSTKELQGYVWRSEEGEVLKDSYGAINVFERPNGCYQTPVRIVFTDEPSDENPLTIRALNQRIATLEAENAALKLQDAHHAQMALDEARKNQQLEAENAKLREERSMYAEESAAVKAVLSLVAPPKGELE